MMRQAKHSFSSHALFKQGLRPAGLLLAVLAASLPLAAQAYVGPGAGLSLLSALWGVIAAIAVAVLFVVMWPIRRMRRRHRARRADELAATQAGDAGPPEGIETTSTKPPIPPRS
ncbi:hypothetical protein R6258_00850 [Halomonas sp. HP20-15]|uniref:hypothetical protein n=1 Tax=Halomonas sp. HP20-15 TaxID=3085901 RepID=UPI002980AAFE|nr:hypothetical protein [Halomonas sp. HP20-15]MDW5375454.1 hypothetical protein [Halomonas sp. HP20-15]